ncbi:hypothetical protein DM01DRAFT_1404782 [Hesseltinella vesiculosa]|uniref:Uncharacterized protein n=1 Tax=Hesseltinella vesiculosa TaxID=101127 RepID=A0A1X2GSQ3_9FUNG|nr:hypothetical protein DM01DRAFT_1404782 [Hesseltinella vesiculosa]
MSPTSPKAVNIIRPNSWKSQWNNQSYSSSSSSSSVPSTISTLSGGSNNTHRLNATLLNTLAPFQSSPWFKSAPIGQNFFRVLPTHRPDIEDPATPPQDEDDIESDDEYDSIDGDTDNEDSQDEDVSTMQIVAKVKNGTIMNKRGELVSRVNDEDARTNRKIADLEIEKASLLTLNATLESKVLQQAERIAELEKQLQINDWPLSPVSDKDMGKEQCLEQLLSNELTEDDVANDQVFQRLRSMLLGLIEQAEHAVRLKTKPTGRVLTNYTRDEPFSHTVHSIQPTPSMATSPRKRTAMQRSLSRQSSPAVLITANPSILHSRPASPTPSLASRPMQRSWTSRPKSGHGPKWQN